MKPTFNEHNSCCGKTLDVVVGENVKVGSRDAEEGEGALDDVPDAVAADVPDVVAETVDDAVETKVGGGDIVGAGATVGAAVFVDGRLICKRSIHCPEAIRSASS